MGTKGDWGTHGPMGPEADRHGLPAFELKGADEGQCPDGHRGKAAAVRRKCPENQQAASAAEAQRAMLRRSPFRRLFPLLLLGLLCVIAYAFNGVLQPASPEAINDTVRADVSAPSAAGDGRDPVSRFPYISFAVNLVLGSSEADEGWTYSPAEYLEYLLSSTTAMSEVAYTLIFDLLEGDLKTHEAIIRFPEAAAFLGFDSGTGSVTHGEIVQLTDGQPVFGFRWQTPAIDAKGGRIAFVSTADLTGDNPDASTEVFLADYHAGTLGQISRVTYPSYAQDVSIDGEGSRVVFASDGDLTGGNPDGGAEVFFYDAATGTISQITSSSGDAGSLAPAISGDGSRILFVSHGDLTGGNPDGGQELFLHETAVSRTTQLTSSASGGVQIHDLALSAGGNRAAFNSLWDFAADSRGTAHRLYLVDTDTGVLTTLGDHVNVGSNAGGWRPALNADGTRVAFESNLDLTGQNPDLSREIFLLDTAASALTQISDSPVAPQGPADTGSILASIDADGTRIAFLSNRDETGQNLDHNSEIFICDTKGAVCTQITDSYGSSIRSAPEISAKGVHIAFQSILDVTGNNADGSEELFLFIADSTDKIGELFVDLDFDGEPEFTRDVRAKNDFLAYFDTDQNGVYDPEEDRTLAYSRDAESRPIVTLTNPAFRLDHLTEEVSVRATIVLDSGLFANPPVSGTYRYLGTLTSVDPDTGGPDDGSGTAPLTREFSKEVVLQSPGAGSLDVDGDDRSDPVTDGMLVLRYLFGFRGDSLTNGAVSQDATRDAVEIESFLFDRLVFLDVDGNRRADALTDGMLVLRYLSAFRGADLIDGAVAPDAAWTTAAEIESALGELK